MVSLTVRWETRFRGPIPCFPLPVLKLIHASRAAWASNRFSLPALNLPALCSAALTYPLPLIVRTPAFFHSFFPLLSVPLM